MSVTATTPANKSTLREKLNAYIHMCYTKKVSAAESLLPHALSNSFIDLGVIAQINTVYDEMLFPVT